MAGTHPRTACTTPTLQALGGLAAYHAGRGEVAPALDYTLRQLALEPWREEATRQAMRLLAARGDRSAALAQYAACRQVLAEELNAEPSAATTALYEHLKAQPPDAGPLPRPRRPPLAHNLPRQLTPFVGREEELRLLIERLDSPDTCLLTLVGPGGRGQDPSRPTGRLGAGRCLRRWSVLDSAGRS